MNHENQPVTGTANPKAKAKSWFTFVGIFSAGLLLVLASLATFQLIQPGSVFKHSGSPSLTVDIEEINLGDIPVGQSVQAVFQLTNTGAQPLKFSKTPYIQVREGC